jgi:MSHA pilin protein MshC
VRNARHLRRISTGFTLVEILCVVVILGIIGVVVGGRIGSRDDLSANSAARILISQLQFAQNRAIARRDAHFIVVSAGSSGVTVCTRDAGSFVGVSHPVEPGDLSMTFGNAGTGGGRDVRLDAFDFGGKAVLGFDTTGEPFVAAANGGNRTPLADAASLTLASGTYSVTIDIEPVTGEVRMR